jgi:hypothetical protein
MTVSVMSVINSLSIPNIAVMPSPRVSKELTIK